LTCKKFSRQTAEITALVRELNENCPTLFETLLTRSEQENFSVALIDEADSQVMIASDANRLRPAAIGRLQATYCRDFLGLPTRATAALPDAFRSALRIAYEKDYGIPNLRHFGKGAIQWCKKVAFHDP